MNLNKKQGFTLVEIAVVLVIVALLGVGVIMTLNVQTQRSQIAVTRASLAETKEALLSYASVHGALPCAASDTAGVAQESCATRGFVPWKDLGLSLQHAQDAWGQTLRYVVTPAMAGKNTISMSTSGTISISSKTSATALNSTGTVAFALWSNGIDQEDTTGTGTTVKIDERGESFVTWVSRYVVIGRMVEAGKVLAP